MHTEKKESFYWDLSLIGLILYKEKSFSVFGNTYMYLDIYVSRRPDQETEALIVFPHRWGPPEVVGQVLGVYDMN